MKLELTKGELLEALKDLDNDVKLNFYLLPDDEGLREHSDEHDELLTFEDVIYTGTDYDEPFVDIGFGRAK
jgi:hypothetical protein